MFSIITLLLPTIHTAPDDAINICDVFAYHPSQLLPSELALADLSITNSLNYLFNGAGTLIKQRCTSLDIPFLPLLSAVFYYQKRHPVWVRISGDSLQASVSKLHFRDRSELKAFVDDILAYSDEQLVRIMQMKMSEVCSSLVDGYRRVNVAGDVDVLDCLQGNDVYVLSTDYDQQDIH